ncbi:LOW QUALITY PROTEIN: hypothetical protein Cgig2_032892 [Carnegiea gigantea]|uniref:Aminotransferase-like plant mobile domain-containing protein n=1 Tax=Carnegiea gigantea TaxID=171969 RepID=A0A9Q1JWH8_9CARY|nr:LOW QUALITY PROTEIN: hypothetical protein Cgig2_032892 [Carnegiea gigantea]
MDETRGNESAPLENGQECGHGLYYRRSSSLQILNAIPSSTLTSILVREVRVKQGTLRYRRNDENKCVDVSRSTFMLGVMEWTEQVLTRFEEPLKQAGIFSANGVSQFPYHFDANVWRDFCELWGPLTNTLHHGAGEVGISLYDFERIYTFLEIYMRNSCPKIKIWWAIINILPQIFGVLYLWRTKTDSGKEKVETKKRSPLHISCQKRMADLNITAEGELAAFLAFWLSRFVLPHDKEVIRPETFVMATLMASGQRVSLAPAVLGYIYHGLGDAANNPDYPGKANTIFPMHYVIGWLAKLFPCLYRRRPDSDCPDDFPTLVCYAGLLRSKLSLPQVRHIFRDGRYLSLRASSYHEDSRNGRDVIDMGLPEEDSKFLLSIRSAVLPVRVGAELILEPYYPNRFSRQFGFDQGVPSNHLSFIRALQ